MAAPVFSSIAAPNTGSIIPQNGSQPIPMGGGFGTYGAQTAPVGNPFNATTAQPQPTLTANVSTPISSGTTASPIVINSGKAQDFLGNAQTQMQALNTDAQNQTVANSQPAQTPATSAAPADTSSSANNSTQQDPAAQLNDQINEILTNLGQGEGEIDNEINNAQTTNNEGQPATFADAQAENQAQMVQAATAANTQLSQIASGTYPLSPAETQLLTSTQNSFMQAIQQQQIANTAFTGQITEAMASLGINTTAPTQALGNIYSAISTGNSKIADLNNQMATSVANLQLGFQKQDYSMVQQNWDNLSKQFEDRQTYLTDMQKSVTDALNTQKADMVDYAKTAISAIQATATMSYNEKQDTIKNALSQAQFTETQNKDLIDEQQNQEKINLQAQAQGIGNGVTGGNPTPVAMNGDGTPNAANQAQFLSQLPPNIQTIVKGLSSYTINPASYSTSAKQAQGGLTRGELVALAQQYDPTYDESQYANRQATIKNFQSGTYSQQINALNTATGHIANLTNAFSELGNSNIGPLNAIANTLEPMVGIKSVSGPKLDIAAVTGELASAFKKSGATDSEISSLGTINSNSTPTDIKSYIENATELMGSKLDALSSTYQSAVGKPPASGDFLSDTAANELLSLKQQGYNINVPQLANTPQVKIQTFYDADPKNAALIDQIMQANPTYQPSDVMSLLQNEGIIQ